MSDIVADQARVWLITGCSTGFGRELVRPRLPRATG